jgi:ribosomal protein S18 acetylase RimI-like enzyme
MLIRECTADDLEPLEEISPSPVNREHARRLERQLAGAETYLLAWHDGVLAGHGAVQWQGCTDAEVRAAFPDCPEIYGLSVRPELRGRGIGTALIGAAEDRVRQRGLRWIGISVDVDNPDAGRLYERLGYLAKMRYRGIWSYLDAAGTKHVVDEPAIFMVKELPS